MREKKRDDERAIACSIEHREDKRGDEGVQFRSTKTQHW